MAGIETGRVTFLPAGIFDWNGTSSRARGRTPLPVARRFGTLSGGRGALVAAHGRTGRATSRPVEDHHRAESTLHDHLDRTEGRLTGDGRRDQILNAVPDASN